MSDEEQRFDFSEGEGVTLSSLPCFTRGSSHQAAGRALENALESLHRIAFGRPGVFGERRNALADFKGCPPTMRAEVMEKVGRLKKDRLQGVIKTLRINEKVSKTQGELAAAVADFFMAPQDQGVADPSTSAAKKRKKSKKPAKAKKAAVKKSTAASPKKETASKTKAASRKKSTAASSSPAPSAIAAAPENAEPSEAEVLLEVYRRVLNMSAAERAVLGVKALRTQLEEHFGLPAGGLKLRKDAITTTASDCVRALREAAEQALTAEQPTTDAEAQSPPAQSEPTPAAAVPATTYVAPMHPNVMPL